MGSDFYQRLEVADWLARLPIFPSELKALTAARSEGATTVVDVGSGSGRLARLCLDLGYTYHAVDPAPPQIKMLKRIFPGVDARIATGSRLDWPDRSHDIALLAFFVLEAIQPESERIATLKEIHRVLRTGGRLFLSTHKAWRFRPVSQLSHWVGSPSSDWGDLIFYGPPRTEGIVLDGVPMHILSRSELRRLARVSGFREIARSGLSNTSRCGSIMDRSRFLTWEAI